MKIMNLKNHKSQRGMSTLIVSLVLLIVATFAVFATSNSVLSEQKLAANDVRTKEVYAAAIKGLEWGIDWISVNLPTTNTADCTANLFDNSTAAGTVGFPCAGLADTTTANLIDGYTHTVTYTMVTDFTVPQPIVLVSSTATAIGDSQVTQTVEQMVERTAITSGSLYDGPPLIVEDGLTGITGTPNVQDGANGYNIGTITGDPTDPTSIDVGHFDDCVVPAGSPEGTACNNGASPALTSADVSQASSTSGSLWTDLFQMSKEEFQILSAKYPTQFYWVDPTTAAGRYSSYLSSTNWNTSVGTLDNPVIIVFDKDLGCTGFTGNGVIYGVVYYEDASSTCSGGGGWDPGWGNMTICGTVAIEGNLTKFTANAGLLNCDLEDDFGGEASKLAKVTPIPNTWKDF